MDDVTHRRVFVWTDKSTWTSVKNDFALNYSHVRGYHGCRPFDVDSYYKNGFLQPQKKKLREQAVFILADKCNTRERIEMLFDKAWKEYYGKGIYFGLCKSELLDNCGHYLIYGSELICGIGRELGLDKSLMSKGTPTLFSVDIPINLIDEGTVFELREVLRNNCRYKTPPDIDFGFCITQPIPPRLIVDCEHPRKIHDPLNWGTYYIHKEAINQQLET